MSHLPVVIAMLLMIATSDTETAQPLKCVSPDCALDNGPKVPPISAEDFEYEPMKMLVVPPYT